MGNRAVITTKKNYDENGVGVYLHWNGGINSIKAFLEYCKEQGYRSPDEDSYGWAYLTATICNYFNDGLSCGVDVVNNLDCDNYDNGVYFIKGWDIESNSYDIDINSFDPDAVAVMITEIKKRQPKTYKLFE